MKKFYDTVYRIFMSFCQLVFVISICVTSYVVFCRYVLHSTPRWGEQTTLLCMVYMTMISASLAVRKDTHIRVTIIDFIVPKGFVKFLKYAAHVVISGFSIFMITSGIDICKVMSRSTLSGIPIKQSFLYASVPIAGVCMLIMESEKIILAVHKLMGKPLPAGYTDVFQILTPRDIRQEEERLAAEKAAGDEIEALNAKKGAK